MLASKSLALRAKRKQYKFKVTRGHLPFCNVDCSKVLKFGCNLWNSLRVREKYAKYALFYLSKATICKVKGHLRSYSWTRCFLPLAMFLPHFIRITRTDWEKSAKL